MYLLLKQNRRVSQPFRSMGAFNQRKIFLCKNRSLKTQKCIIVHPELFDPFTEYVILIVMVGVVRFKTSPAWKSKHLTLLLIKVGDSVKGHAIPNLIWFHWVELKESGYAKHHLL